MNGIIRNMKEEDRACVIAMMREFYSSEAVWSNGSEEIFSSDVDCCVNGSPYLEGYVFEKSGEVLGYAMVAKSFSTEFGKPCMWIEDLFLKENGRGLGIGTQFLKYMEETYPDAILRLEVESENERAVHVYEQCGFTVLPYMEMKK